MNDASMTLYVKLSNPLLSQAWAMTQTKIRSPSAWQNVCIHIYIYMCIHIHVYIYIYIILNVCSEQTQEGSHSIILLGWWLLVCHWPIPQKHWRITEGSYFIVVLVGSRSPRLVHSPIDRPLLTGNRHQNVLQAFLGWPWQYFEVIRHGNTSWALEVLLAFEPVNKYWSSYVSNNCVRADLFCRCHRPRCGSFK